MSEELSASAPEGVDPLATSLAMAGASRAKADAFLDDQRHHMHEQLKEIGLRLWELRLGVMLRIATLIVGLAAATGVGMMVWQAAHSNGLIIEPFNVPPDLAAKGMTGEVIAAKVLDELVSLQGQTNSGRPAKSYANSWGEHGIKLEIPETGISLNELDNWLRQKLGHDMRLSGELVRSDDGITLTARSDSGAVSVSGSEKDLNALTVKLAEQAYRSTQPFRYAVYLADKNRRAEAQPIFRELSLHGDHEDRMWAYSRWAATLVFSDGVPAGLKLMEQAIAAEPEAVGAYDVRNGMLLNLGRTEEALANRRTMRDVLLDGRQTYTPVARIPNFKRVIYAKLASDLGAWHEAEPIWLELSHTGYPGYTASAIRGPLMSDQIGAHELTAARATLAEVEALLPPPPGVTRWPGAWDADMEITLASEDWHAAKALLEPVTAVAHSSVYDRSILSTTWAPELALAHAGLGQFAQAERLIAPSPAECYPCLRARAQIAAKQGQNARADFWFARAAAIGPSLPFAEQDWGRALLVRGNPDAAIAQFTIANRKSAHFADAIEGWGEALMAKNQSHLALAKFAEAEKYAPNWGRLHLKWGEALYYAGKRDDARAQFARAAVLDLTPSEKPELARMNHV